MILQKTDATKKGYKQAVMLATQAELELMDEALRFLKKRFPVTNATRPTVHRMKAMRREISRTLRKMK